MKSGPSELSSLLLESLKQVKRPRDCCFGLPLFVAFGRGCGRGRESEIFVSSVCARDTRCSVSVCARDSRCFCLFDRLCCLFALLLYCEYCERVIRTASVLVQVNSCFCLHVQVILVVSAFAWIIPVTSVCR